MKGWPMCLGPLLPLAQSWLPASSRLWPKLWEATVQGQGQQPLGGLLPPLMGAQQQVGVLSAVLPVYISIYTIYMYLELWHQWSMTLAASSLTPPPTSAPSSCLIRLSSLSVLTPSHSLLLGWSGMWLWLNLLCRGWSSPLSGRWWNVSPRSACCLPFHPAGVGGVFPPHLGTCCVVLVQWTLHPWAYWFTGCAARALPMCWCSHV